jgi:hypothetical protein
MVTSAWRMVPVALTSMAPTAVILWAFIYQRFEFTSGTTNSQDLPLLICDLHMGKSYSISEVFFAQTGRDGAAHTDETEDNGGWFYCVGQGADPDTGTPGGIPGAGVAEQQVELWTLCPPPMLDSPDGYEPAQGWTKLFQQTAGNYMAADAWTHVDPVRTLRFLDDGLLLRAAVLIAVSVGSVLTLSVLVFVV